MPFIAIFDLLPKLRAQSAMGRGIGGQYTSEILFMHSWHLNSHSVSFQHALSFIRMKSFLLFSRIQIIFRLTSDLVETSIPRFPEHVISSSEFIAVASRSVDYYHIRTSSLAYLRGGAPYPSGYSLPLLGSASFSALALVHALSVALLRPVSLLL